MEYVTGCPACRGEGSPTYPPYDARYLARPYRARVPEDCARCGGRGVLAATLPLLLLHDEAARQDYRQTGTRYPS